MRSALPTAVNRRDALQKRHAFLLLDARLVRAKARCAYCPYPKPPKAGWFLCILPISKTAESGLVPICVFLRFVYCATFAQIRLKHPARLRILPCRKKPTQGATRGEQGGYICIPVLSSSEGDSAADSCSQPARSESKNSFFSNSDRSG